MPEAQSTLPSSTSAVADGSLYAPPASAVLLTEYERDALTRWLGQIDRAGVDGARSESFAVQDLARRLLRDPPPAKPFRTTHILKHEPGNGTSYRLVVVLDGTNIRLISWPDVCWSAGDFGDHVSAEWLARSAARDRKRGCAAFTLVDAQEIAAVVNALVERKRRGDPV